jgi:hypothetical protein
MAWTTGAPAAMLFAAENRHNQRSKKGMIFNASKGQISILTPLQSFFLYLNYL